VKVTERATGIFIAQIDWTAPDETWKELAELKAERSNESMCVTNLDSGTLLVYFNRVQ